MYGELIAAKIFHRYFPPSNVLTREINNKSSIFYSHFKNNYKNKILLANLVLLLSQLTK